MDYAYFKGIIFGGGQADVKLYGFSYLGELDLESELSGKTRKLTAFVENEKEGTVICGAYLKLYGFTRLSVVVAHNGRLIDIADRTLSGEEDDYEDGRELKVYTLNGVRLALLVDSDIDNEFIWEKLDSNADVIVSVARSLSLEQEARVKALSKTYGLPAVIKTDEKLYVMGETDKEQMS